MTSPRRMSALDAVRAALLVVVLIAVAVALWRNWAAISSQLWQLDLRVIGGALVLGLIPPVLTMLGWRVLLADLGTRLPLPPAASIYFVGQLGKYVPGSVWTVVMQTEMGHRLRVPRRQMATAGLVMLALSVLGGAVVALPAVPLLLTESDTTMSAGWGALAALVALLLLVVLWPTVLNALIARGLRMLRREPLEHDLSGAAIARCMACIIASWVGTGASVLLLAAALAPDDPGSLVLVCISGFALASVAGMVAVLLPAGVGVREGILFLLLTSVMSPAAATAVVVLTRFLSVLADVLWAAAGWLWARAHHLLPAGGRGAVGG
ncbi:lysylphosphatidylglycerol synthase domain-containing protein [Knoellia sp. S7-12]|uniref:lysylphosphatidylglycerol synthase domain-containing protein n=1 Tax=Knoellia sp. S7-12 TaxID=3126698 RepID=UPI003365C5FD